MTKKRIVIIGATSAIAKHCGRLWIKENPMELFLVGRDLLKLSLISDDLKVRNPECLTHTIQIDFNDPERIQKLSDEIAAKGRIDVVLIAHGLLADQKQCQDNLILCKEMLNINGISPALFAESFVTHMQKENHGTLAIISSVAGDRGRKSNYIYGAAKSLVTCYVEGLQHRFSNTNVRIHLIKPGPTETPMTAHLKEKGAKLARVEDVAHNIVSGLKENKPVIYTPKKWRFIMIIIRLLPSFIFNKMNI